MRDLLKRRENEVSVDKEEENPLVIIVRDKQIINDRKRGTYEIPTYEEGRDMGVNYYDDGFFDPGYQCC